ncbi:MAG: cytochrome c biogenesis protein ResB [Desulfobacteraceae bacterium]
MTPKNRKTASNPVWQLFISVKLTAVLLALLAVTSAAGTFIPQSASPEQYAQMYGALGYNLIQVFDLFDMYHSWWFRSLLGLLAANIIICTLDRWPLTWKTVSAGAVNPERLLKRKPAGEFKESRTPDELKPLYESFMTEECSVQGEKTVNDGFVVYGEKGRWSRLGVPVVHLSVVLILVGALVGSFWGFDGYVNIPEGGSAERIHLRNSNEIKELGFEVFCKDFAIEYYESGAVSEYKSTLQIRKNGEIAAEKDVIVNDPLQYNGIRFFQSSYGALPPENLEIKIQAKKSGEFKTYSTKIGKTVKLPGDAGEFTVSRFNKDYHFKTMELGQAVEGVLSLKGGEPVPVVLPLRFPTFDKMRKGEWVVSLEEHDNKFYTGLSVRRDPGVSLVYLGFLLMLGGCWVIFFHSHQKILIKVTPLAESSMISIYASTSKHKVDLKRQVEKITTALKRL